MWSPPERILSVPELIAATDQTVAGLKDQKARLATAITRHGMAAAKGREYPPVNVIVLGPTGGGKTYMTKKMLEASGLPFVEINATQYTEAGYQGLDIGWMFYGFIDKYTDTEQRPRDLIPLVEGYGVVVLDEFDKWRVQLNLKERQPARALQGEMLKVVEGDMVSAKRSDKDQGWIFHTRNILYIACGAFDGLGHQIGTEEIKDHMLVEPLDLVRYGFMSELIGRFPNLIPLPVLEVDAMTRIFYEHFLPRYQQEAEDYGCVLEMGDSACRELAGQAIQTRTGARAFSGKMESILWKAWSTAKPGDIVTVTVASVLGGEAELRTPVAV